MPLKERLELAPPERRGEALQEFVGQQTARVLGLESNADLDPHLGFFDLGMDSLTSVELRNRLQMELGCVLPTTLTFDCPNVAAVKRYLAKEILRWDEPQAAPAQSSGADDGLDELDEGAIAELLKRKVESMPQALQSARVD